ncbi:7480_t:CDS:2 [Dentiscutata erythropus]|uniref:7480_t:CDS:1 n=1 Tax=Dentiscutata erythropus TaxID=1348616 RepID=A0A9N9J274_9GLOM|nr:7480_t:CDS:2 [Dentiscutata erythropus]
MNDVGVVDGDSGDIYNKFFGIYDLRKVFAVEFFAWLLAQGIESDFNDDQCTNNFFLRVDKLQNDECWRPYKKDFNETRKKKGQQKCTHSLHKYGDKNLMSHTLKYIENLENKLIPMTSFDKSLRKRFITNIRAISKWTLMDKNNIEIDVVKTICRSITEEMIMNLEYNNPLLSYVVDFSNLSKEIKDAFDEQVLITMTTPPIKFYRDMDPTSEKYLVYLYENQQVCEKLFPQVSDASSLFMEQYFLWKACYKLFEMWNSNNFNKDFTTTFNEGTWEHFVLHPLFNILTLSLDKCVGESSSSASKYRKTENIKFEKETPKKADTWIEMMIAKNLHEIVFAETSGSPFQATCTTKKVYNDKCKLIRFGHDSKNKMLDELIEKKCIYLSDWKNLCNEIRKAELLLFQAYKAKLKVFILDCPAHPFCRVGELFDLDIPYKKVAIEEFKLFIQALWAIRCALSDIIHDYEKIGEKLLKDYNKIAGSGPYEIDCGVRDGWFSWTSPVIDLMMNTASNIVESYLEDIESDDPDNFRYHRLQYNLDAYF